MSRFRGRYWRRVLLLSAWATHAAGAQVATQQAQFRPMPSVADAGSPLAQTISVNLQNVAIEDAVRQIASQAGVRLAFADVLATSPLRVSLAEKSIAVTRAFQSALSGSRLMVLASSDQRAIMIVPASAITGRILSAARGPIAGAQIRLPDLGLATVADDAGEFRFAQVPAGRHIIRAQRLGIVPVVDTVTVAADATSNVVLNATLSTLQLAGVVITGVSGSVRENEAFRSTSVLDRERLRRTLASSVSATVAGEPGITQRFNGPAAAQPIIRGLGGDRVLVLEDGQRTGDIAGTAADHAVTIEALTAKRMEVVRGPAGLLYGSNVLGGVINVIRDDVPRSMPARAGLDFGSQFESAIGGAVVGATATVPLGALAVRAEGTARRAGDTRTPFGVLPSTNLNTYTIGAGVSAVRSNGYAGVAARDYNSRYGVPGTFNGRTIPGAHAGGVYIDLRRSTVRAEAEWRISQGPITALRVEGNYVRFVQDEIERGGIIGTQFGQLTGTATATARFQHTNFGAGNGLLGMWLLHRDFSAAGSFTGSRPTKQIGLAGYAIDETRIGALRMQTGVRYDWTRIVPQDSSASRLLKDLSTRSMGAVTGSVALVWDARGGLSSGISVARSFRSPAIEELYSNGPHLANYAYEIGNPKLDAETGVGFDIFLRLQRSHINADVSVFKNNVNGFIYYNATGQLDPRFRRYPVYQAAQSDAELRGIEGRLSGNPVSQLTVSTRASYVRGNAKPDNAPLPAMPPVSWSADALYTVRALSLSVGGEGAGDQQRVGEFEAPTLAYALLNASAGVQRTIRGRPHSLTLVIRNFTNVAWQDHLSRVRAVAPQPGRNVQLLYRAQF